MWDHIKLYFNQDCKLPVRMAPELTRKLIELPPFSQLGVYYAAQILRHSVYAGVTTRMSLEFYLYKFKRLEIFFKKKMDGLFNCFNVKTPKSKKPYNHAITATLSHHDFLLECLL